MNNSKQVLRVTEVRPSVVNSLVYLPLYNSRPSAGFPSAGDDMVEKPLDLNDLLIDNPATTFFVKVEGDSMEGERIFSGDILVVDRSLAHTSGKIVIAAVYGEMVVKRLEIKNGQARLMSANKAYKPIIINENEDCFIWGVVVGSVRIFK